MHLFTKKNVDNVAIKVIYSQPKVLLRKLTQEDINQYKLDFNDEKFRVPNPKKRLIEENKKPSKKAKLDEKGPGVLKLVLSREGETDKFKSKFISSPSFVNDNASTSSAEKTNAEDITKLTKSKNSLIGKIKVRDPRTMIDEVNMGRFNSLFLEKKLPKAQRTGIKKFVIPSNYSPNMYIAKRGNLSLTEIEDLYKKYFSKSIQDSIVIIANILNVISMSNKHHKSRMDESFKKRSEAEKLKERCDANRIHTRHKKVLEAKLKTTFNEVILTFSTEEFEPAFQMFFLSILTVLRVLDQPKFKRGSIFKNLVLLLWNSLKSSEFEHARIFNMFRSKSFRPDCIDLISLIEDTRDNDPSITDRMALFFVSSVSSKDCFQCVINAVTGDSVEDLGQLIENAAQQLRSCSKFKEPQQYLSSTAIQPSPKEISNDQSKVISDVIHPTDDNSQQHWVIAKGPNGLYQPIPLMNKPQITSESTTKPLNAFYETFSNSLITKCSTESINPKVVAPKVSIVTTTSVPNGPPRATPTIVTFKQSIHNIRPLPTTTIQRPEGNTIYLGSTKYQVVRAPARTHQNSNNNIVLKTQPKIIDSTSLCYAENCTVPATIMCSTCTSVKYCSNDCQRLDWYASHITNCDRLRRKYNSL